jgi:hypothetical protein
MKAQSGQDNDHWYGHDRPNDPCYCIVHCSSTDTLKSLVLLIAMRSCVSTETIVAFGCRDHLVSSHGRGLDRLLLDSVSEAAAIHPSCSVRIIQACPQIKGESHATS